MHPFTQVAVAEASNCDFELLPHPTYSSDLAPPDLLLFPKLKSYQRENHFAVKEFLEDQDVTFLRNGIEILEYHRTKYIDIKGARL